MAHWGLLRQQERKKERKALDRTVQSPLPERVYGPSHHTYYVMTMRQYERTGAFI